MHRSWSHASRHGSRYGNVSPHDAAVQLHRAHMPNPLLLDATMEGLSGTEALAQIKREYPDAFVIMLTRAAISRRCSSASRRARRATSSRTRRWRGSG